MSGQHTRNHTMPTSWPCTACVLQAGPCLTAQIPVGMAPLSLTDCFDLLPGFNPLAVSIQKSPLGCSQPLCGTRMENMHHWQEHGVKGQSEQSQLSPAPWVSHCYAVCSSTKRKNGCQDLGRVFPAVLHAAARDGDLTPAHKGTCAALSSSMLATNHCF